VSNALAIASVTAVLKDLLNNGVIDHQLSNVVGEVTVSALPPDRVLVAGQAETSRINLFMYQVSHNAAYRNSALPSRSSAGDRVSNPPLALDLHYLVSTYGANEFDAEILLGYAMQLLHETPVLTREAIRRTLAPASPVTGAVLPPPFNALVASELADQLEQIRLTPAVMGVEDVSKLWTAIQSHYRPTALYHASVVLIESKRSTRSALPVANDKRRLYVVPFTFPAIVDVVSALGDREPILVGSTLVIRGRDLVGDRTFINLDGMEFTPPPATMKADRIELPLPAPLPAGLFAGIKGIQVIQKLQMGEPPVDHRGFESNAAAFVLRPTITNGPVIPPTDLLSVVNSTETINGSVVQLRAGRMRVGCDPRIGREQRVTLILNEINVAPGAVTHAYTFAAPASNGLAPGVLDTAAVEIPFTRVVAGTYVVRVQIDGAESVLAQDASGAFVSPRVVFA
jgi:hypothetical protein